MTNKPDKGKKDGSCNVTACQKSLVGSKGWYMKDNVIENGRLYYCDDCAREFNRWDKRSGDPQRCFHD